MLRCIMQSVNVNLNKHILSYIRISFCQISAGLINRSGGFLNMATANCKPLLLSPFWVNHG